MRWLSIEPPASHWETTLCHTSCAPKLCCSEHDDVPYEWIWAKRPISLASTVRADFVALSAPACLTAVRSALGGEVLAACLPESNYLARFGCFDHFDRFLLAPGVG
jgi:hypothetical protein